MKSQYKRWQVALGVIVFVMLMGIVGRMDYESQVAVSEHNSFAAQAMR